MKKPQMATGRGTAVQWDITLLDGSNWMEIPNIGTGNEAFFGPCNPDLWRLILRGSFDAVICHTGYLTASFWNRLPRLPSQRLRFSLWN
jgi:hypothetical protein